MTDELPLGKQTDYPDNYAPDLLFPIPRADARAPLGIETPLPFSGVDVWNAWELTWLSRDGQPAVATAEIRVPADSPNIIESKSLKLYLNSFAMSRQPGADRVAETIRRDLGAAADTEVEVRVEPASRTERGQVATLHGTCLDDLEVACDQWQVDASLLERASDRTVSESLHTHALRSLCPVTSQPDTGSLLVRYDGPEIDRAALLRYIVSYRRHQDFHEACVERIFLDILARCSPTELTVYARYQRRGGIDINPWRSSIPGTPDNPRLWRQ